jgi:hypothetical protein
MAKKDTKPYSAKAHGPFPIHRGPFLFGPHFLSRAEWSITFQTLISTFSLKRISLGKSSARQVTD